MPDTIHLRINNQYALSIIENLEKMHAVDFISAENDEIEIPETVKEETRRRLLLIKDNPETAISLDQFQKHLQTRLDK